MDGVDKLLKQYMGMIEKDLGEVSEILRSVTDEYTAVV